MAITKLISPSTPNPLPPAGAGGDWDKAMAQLTAVKKLLSGEQMILTQWTNTTTAPALAEGSYLQHMGAIYVVDTEDYALPALSADGTYYIKLTISGETLVPSYITDLTGFSWSAQHNGLYNASDEQVLHYQVVKNASAIEKYKMLNPYQVNDFASVNYLGRYHGRELHVTGNATIGGTLGVTGAISGATVNTGQGANELYAMNQNVRTTDSPTFNTLGFTSLNPDSSVETSIQLSAGSSYTLPKGAYAIKIETTSVSVACQMYHNSSWITIFGGTGGFVISDGVNFRLSHLGGSGTFNISIRKW